MNDHDVAISRAIHSRRRAIWEAVVEWQYAQAPELRDRYGEHGRDKCVEDTEYHLAHLSAALLASSPALFADYIDWAGAVMSVADMKAERVAALQAREDAAARARAEAQYERDWAAAEDVIARRRLRSFLLGR